MNQLSFEFDEVPLRGETVASKVKKLCEDLIKFEVDIREALEYSHGSYTFDDVCQGVLTGRFHLYPLKNSLLVMEFQQFPQYSIYHAFIASGSLDELMPLHEDIRLAAKVLGAKYASLSGRPGWIKQLKSLGWQHAYSTMYTEV